MTIRLGALIVGCGVIAACSSGPVTVPRDTILYEVPRPAPQPAPTRVELPPPSPAVRPLEPVPVADDFASRIERVLGPEPVQAQPEPWAAAETAPPAVAVAPAPQAAAPQATAPRTTAPQTVPEVFVEAPQPAPVPQGTQATPLDDDRLNLNLYTLEQQRIDAAIAERELEAARQQLVIVEPGASVPQMTPGVNIALYAQQTSHRVGERLYPRSITARALGGNCRRFSSADEAQRVFLASGGPERDPYNLDPDGDGFACNWDPEPFRRLRM